MNSWLISILEVIYAYMTERKERILPILMLIISSDHLLGYKIGPTLNMWDDGKLSALTYFAQDYKVKDSIIVFDDTRFNTPMYIGKIHHIC